MSQRSTKVVPHWPRTCAESTGAADLKDATYKKCLRLCDAKLTTFKDILEDRSRHVSRCESANRCVHGWHGPIKTWYQKDHVLLRSWQISHGIDIRAGTEVLIGRLLRTSWIHCVQRSHSCRSKGALFWDVSAAFKRRCFCPTSFIVFHLFTWSIWSIWSFICCSCNDRHRRFAGPCCLVILIAAWTKKILCSSRSRKSELRTFYISGGHAFTTRLHICCPWTCATE